MGKFKRNEFAIVFLLLSGVLLWFGLQQHNPFLSFLLLSAGGAFLGLSVAYLFTWPGLLAKTRKGTLLPSSYVLFWPYHLLNYGSLLYFRLLGVAPFQEIVPGLFLGGRLLPWESQKIKPAGITAVLDLTCELNEVDFLRQNVTYCCIPLLDGSAPPKAALEAGVRFIQEKLRTGPVYVHCAMGHGRSATFVAAYLLATRQASTVSEAIERMRSRRPGVRLRAEQIKSLENFVHERRDL